MKTASELLGRDVLMQVHRDCHDRFMEYPELEGIHKDCGVQLL